VGTLVLVLAKDGEVSRTFASQLRRIFRAVNQTKQAINYFHCSVPAKK